MLSCSLLPEATPPVRKAIPHHSLPEESHHHHIVNSIDHQREIWVIKELQKLSRSLVVVGAMIQMKTGKPHGCLHPFQMTETMASPSEASSRSPSASMSESESEADFAPTEDKPIFPYEKLYADAKEKSRIQALPEIEREELLAQRSEQVEHHEQDLALRRLIATRAKDEAKNAAKNKRKAGAADLEESQRKSSRQRTKRGGGRAGEASSAIEAYKQQRAEKSLRDEQRRRDGATRRAVSPNNDYSDERADSESDNDFDERKYRRRTPTPPRDDPPAELVDIQRAKVGRENFAQVCETPGFEEAVTNCYARVCVGPGRNPGVNEYRMCLIKGFTTGRPYAMTGPNGLPFPVNRYIIAAHGTSERPWSFLECSMSKFTDDEWRRYRVVMANENCKMPTRGTINRKLEEINKLINHRFTDADITNKMNKRRALLDMINKNDEKAAIQERMAEAIRAHDDEKVAALEDELAAIVPMKLALNTSLSRSDATYVNPEQEKLAEINRRNARLNAENVRKAQLAEMKVRKKKHLAPGVDELFEGGSDISRTGTPVNGQRNGTPKPAGTPHAGTPRSSTPNPLRPTAKGGLPLLRRAMGEEEIMRNMDLGIDIDI
jgi:RNA polymerase-associated protein RTF1